MERNSLISERYLLRGAPNARDLGGLPTMDGRKVRTGLLLRSGELAGITDADARTLSQYPLRTVIDFRTDLEREQKPDRVLAGVRYIHCPIVQQAAAGLTREEQADPYGAVVAHAKTMAGKERAFMCELYRGLVTREFSVDHYRQFFALLLAQTDGALLYHCTAGKDRVGVGTMLLLTALGVLRTRIFLILLAGLPLLVHIIMDLSDYEGFFLFLPELSVLLLMASLLCLALRLRPAGKGAKP